MSVSWWRQVMYWHNSNIETFQHGDWFMRGRWIKRFECLTFSLWIILSLGLAVISFMYFGVDFRGYYAAARVLMIDGNPYDYHQVAAVLLDVTGSMGNNPYYYPPWFAWLFVPLAFLPYQIARGIWMGLNLMFWNISLWRLRNLLNWQGKGWRLYTLFVLSTLTFSWITMRYEQASILVFAILISFIISIQKEQWNQSGVWLALLLIKPNITLLLVIVLSLWLIRKNRWGTVVVMFSTLSFLLGGATWITPDWFKPFFEPGFLQGLTSALDGPSRVIAPRINTTFLDWLSIFGVSETVSLILYGVLGLIGFVLLIWVLFLDTPVLGVTGISLLISYAVTPYALQYDYAPLVFVLFWALSLCTMSLHARRGGIMLAIFVFSVSIWQQNIAWGYWIIIGLAALTIWGFYHSFLYKEVTHC